MSDTSTFTHYAETTAVVDDGNRSVHVSLGTVGGLELAHIGVGSDGQHVDVLLTIDEMRSVTEALQQIDPAYQERGAGYYLYKVVITTYPDGALIFYKDGDGEEYGYPNEDWEPQGWNPSDEWIAMRGPKFFWPTTKREYRSKSSARERARLIESFGAKTEVIRSSVITWPAGAE